MEGRHWQIVKIADIYGRFFLDEKGGRCLLLLYGPQLWATSIVCFLIYGTDKSRRATDTDKHLLIEVLMIYGLWNYSKLYTNLLAKYWHGRHSHDFFLILQDLMLSLVPGSHQDWVWLGDGGSQKSSDVEWPTPQTEQRIWFSLMTFVQRTSFTKSYFRQL